MTGRHSRNFFLVILSGGLFALYFFVRSRPLIFGEFGDVREIMFGPAYRGLLFAALVPAVFLFVRLFDYFAFDIALRRRKRVAAPRLLRDIVSLGLYFLLFSWTVAGILQYPVTKWLAATTVLAAILALALQETLGNLFSGIALHLEDAFEVGDVIKSGDVIGVVETLSWRSTRIRTFAGNNPVYLPNAVLSRERLEVFPQRSINARIVQVPLDANTPPAVMISILTQAAAHVEGVSRDVPCFARIGSFGDSTIMYEIKYFTREYDRRDRIDADIKKAVWYALQRNDIALPLPIRSFQPYTPPTRDHSPTSQAIRERLQRVDVLLPLSDQAREELASSAKVRFYSRGEAIIRHGSAGESMFILHEGTVSIRMADDSEVAQLGPGSVFGEISLLTGETRTANVVASTDVTAIEVTREALKPIMEKNPQLAAAITERVMERRQKLNESLSASDVDDDLTIRTRILSFFGLRQS